MDCEDCSCDVYCPQRDDERKRREALARIADRDAALEIRMTEEEKASTGFGAVFWAIQLINGTQDTDHSGAVY